MLEHRGMGLPEADIERGDIRIEALGGAPTCEVVSIPSSGSPLCVRYQRKSVPCALEVVQELKSSRERLQHLAGRHTHRVQRFRGIELGTVRPQDPTNVAKGVLTKTRSFLGVISQRCGQDRRLSRRNAESFQAGSSGGQEGSVAQIPALDPQDPGLARSVRPKRATNIEQERHEASSPPTTPADSTLSYRDVNEDFFGDLVEIDLESGETQRTLPVLSPAVVASDGA